MQHNDSSRRRFLKLASGAVIVAPALAAGSLAAEPAATRAGRVRVVDAALRLEFDDQLRSRIAVVRNGREVWLTDFGASESVDLAGGHRVERFTARQEHVVQAIADAHGSGTETAVTGLAADGIEKILRIRQYERHPGLVLYRVAYVNRTASTVDLKGWTNGDFRLRPSSAPTPGFWSYSGASYADRRDWLQPVGPGFAQDNFMGMSASDYGGGTPIADVWGRDGGVAIGHLAPSPRLVSLPIREDHGGARLCLHAGDAVHLSPGESLETLETLLVVHVGDHFAALDTYRRLMAERGMRPATPPAESYEPIWCAWGYERDCTSELIKATLPKVKELGLDWVVIDDGWQAAIGDWRLNPQKYPAGDADLHNLLGAIRAADLKPRLWYSPLAAAPGSDLLHDQTDLLLLDKDGAPQAISWWNSFYLCPAYEKTRSHTLGLVQKFFGEWGFAGLKIDGQHLNGVAPCYNPAHHHVRPEESVEQLPAFFRDIYQTAIAINPNAVIELCPCGTAYSFYDFPAMNQAPASDPESSWQVRLKGKTLKALMGPSAPFAGDHVELSDQGDDFASTVGIGAVVSTKFTWPVDPKPKDSFLLTSAKEVLWRKWIALYREKRLAEGVYHGELYDIGFDKPEGHVIERRGHLYYAFYAPQWRGALTLRGLGAGTYLVHDYFNDRPLGTVSVQRPTLDLSFDRFLLLEAVPA
jgi:alpha-galactosidase